MQCAMSGFFLLQHCPTNCDQSHFLPFMWDHHGINASKEPPALSEETEDHLYQDTSEHFELSIPAMNY